MWLDLLNRRSSIGGVGVSFVVVPIGVGSSFDVSILFGKDDVLLLLPLPCALVAVLVDWAGSVEF